MAIKLSLCLLLLALLTGFLAVLLPPDTVYAYGRTAPTPTLTPMPLLPAKVGSNAPLAFGALLLVVILLFGVVLNIRRRK